MLKGDLWWLLGVFEKVVWFVDFTIKFGILENSEKNRFEEFLFYGKIK